MAVPRAREDAYTMRSALASTICTRMSLRKLTVAAGLLLFLILSLAFFNSRHESPFFTKSIEDGAVHMRWTNTSSASSTHPKKPLFVIHVGPPKSATTFLQNSLCKDFPFTEPLLARDNFVYLGSCPFLFSDPQEIRRYRQFLPHLVMNITGFPTDRKIAVGPIPHDKSNHTQDEDVSSSLVSLLPESFVQKVETLLDRNVLLIYEQFSRLSDMQIQAFANYLNPRFHVKIVIAHRSFYDWFPSQYNQIQKLDGCTLVWPGMRPCKPPLSPLLVPNSGKVGVPVRPFALDDRGRWTYYVEFLERYLVHPVGIVRNNFALYFDDVTIMYMDRLPRPSRGDPVLNYLFCTLLPSPRTCEQVDKIGFYNDSNPSVSFNYDMLAVAAFRSHLIGNTRNMSRTTVHERIEQFQQSGNESEIDFPLKCLPDETLMRLERLSLALDQSLYGKNEWTKELEQAHHAGFEKKRLDNKTFCWVDAEEVLKDDKWVSFFRSLSY